MLARWDVIIGALFAIIVVFFIVVACAATMLPNGQRRSHVPGRRRRRWRPLAEGYASTLFAIGLLNAALFAASILPLSTAYTRVRGDRVGARAGPAVPRGAAVLHAVHGDHRRSGAGIVLLPRAPLLRIMLLSQVMNGLLLPVILILMLLLVTRRSLMGKLAMSRPYTMFCWGICALLIILDGFLLATTLFHI